MREHTPGPWQPSLRRDGNVEILDADGDGVMAIVYGDDNDPLCWPVSANAKLMAAAPALADELATLATAASEMRCRCSLEEISSGHHVDCGKPALLERVDRAIAVLAIAGRLP